MDNKKNISVDTQQEQPRHVITSENSPALAAKIKQASAHFLKVNDWLYKDLANK